MTGRLTRRPGPASTVDVEPPTVTGPLVDVISPDARVELLYEGSMWSEGPVWWRGGLVFSDIWGRRVLRWEEDGSVRTLVDPSEFANGHTVTPDDRLLQCEHARRAVSEVQSDGSTRVLVDRYDGGRLNSPNDVTATRDGAIWFTDPTFGITHSEQGYLADPDLDHTSVYRLDPDGQLHRVVDLDQPNGIAFSPDETTLWVTQTPEGGDAAIFAFGHDPETHRIGERRLFARVPRGIPDGILVDHRGWVWSSSDGGVHVYAADGAHLGDIPAPGVVSNVAFDATGDRLFMTGDQVWGIRLDGTRPFVDA